MGCPNTWSRTNLYIGNNRKSSPARGSATGRDEYPGETRQPANLSRRRYRVHSDRHRTGGRRFRYRQGGTLAHTASGMPDQATKNRIQQLLNPVQGLLR